MKRRYIALILVALLILMSLGHSAEQVDNIKAAVKSYYSHLEKEDINGAMALYHEQAPHLLPDKTSLENYRKTYKQSHKIIKYEKLGHSDGDVIIAVVVETTYIERGTNQTSICRYKRLMVWSKNGSGEYRLWNDTCLPFTTSFNKKMDQVEQGAAGQPATRPESKSESNQSESEGRSK